MKCPVDGATLLISERQNVEIDYCPDCRGVWLDRGELDKLLSRNDDDFDREYRQHYPERGREHQPAPGGYPPKKRKRFLSEVFDFD